MSQPIDFHSRVALSLVRGWRNVRIFGDNHDADIGTEDIWRYGGVKVWPTTAAVLSVVSSSAADGVAGTGARQILVNGLDANYDEISEVITLNGLTPVASVASFLRINLCRVTGIGGSGGVNAGNITVTIGGNVQAYIEAGLGMTHLSHYTVPAGHSLIVHSVTASTGRGQSADNEVSLWLRLYLAGGFQDHTPWFQVSNFDLYESVITGAGEALPVAAKSDIRGQVLTTGNNVHCSLELDCYLVQEGYESAP